MDIDKTREPYPIDPNALAEWVKSKTDEGGRTVGKMSQNKLAKLLGCTSATISRWKSDKAGKSLYRETIEAIAKFEEISFDVVLEKLSPVTELVKKPDRENQDKSAFGVLPKSTKPNEEVGDIELIKELLAKQEEENRFFREQLQDLRELVDTLAQELNERTKSRTSKR